MCRLFGGKIDHYLNELLPYVLILIFILVPVYFILLGIDSLGAGNIAKSVMLIAIGGVILLAEIIIGARKDW
jgi:hypothetical protein